ncbi:autotransporter outer membrane beta-barrel domain-containing protein [uncultured Pluralibacter sp.]|uniref:autotransporter outer membrane beta-barrel domain-containing protein n=1 Tax=uncultured Pluralibacter sp. TaxID=1490864 RepID=UPI002610C0D6|nr:autotransporter outer membrane beta-barrel domain-containing protein [uncultured Pluralibacter sp.]
MSTSSTISAGENSSASIVNTGTISNSPEHSSTLNVQSDLTEIYNSGIIENTLEGGYAIQGGGDNASLYLAGDWQINGHVSLGGKVSKLGLTGDSDSFLDISRIRTPDWYNLPPDSIMGFNTLEKTGSSLWTLYGEQASGGFTTATIDEGGLLLSNATLRMAPVTGEDTDDSTAPRHALTNNAALYSEGTSVLNGSLVNNGAVFMNNGATTRPVFNTLTVTGDYTGQKGSTLVFNTRLGNDRSQTDRLMIKGNTAGESQVIVNNLGGKGAQTVEGIKLISVDGQSDGVFRKADGTRIVAGAYDYDLAKSDGQNWYLSSSAAKTSPMMLSAEMANGVAPAAVTAAGAAPTLTAAAGPAEKVWRPESGSYAANLLAANTLFNTTLHDRAGESQYTDILTGEQRVTSMWLRNVGGHQRSKMSDGQNKTQANRYVMQLGGDVAQWSSSGSDRYHLGVMAGYANQKSRTRSSVSDYSSRGQINGYSAGLYGTWYANNADKSGLYVDSWLQYGWFNNSVKGDAIASESYKSRGLTGSLETGYAFKVGETTSRNNVVNSFWLQPQAQATWMGVKAKKHTETNGTRVEGKGQDNVQTRLGLKAYMQGHSALDNNKERTFQPYVAANWIHNTKKMGVTMDGESNHISGTKNLGEVKVGVEGQLNRNLNLWGGFAQQIGTEGYSDSQASVGIKYQF